MPTVTTFCRICEASCGLLADVDRGELVALRPDPDHVVSRGYACVKGIRYADVHRSADRLRHPLRRVGDRFERVGWDDALAEIGARYRAIRATHGPHATGFYIGNPVAFSTLHPIFLKGFLSALGTRNVFSSGSQDCNNKFLVSQLMYGSPAHQPIPDLDATRCLVVLGSNPAVSHMSFVHAPRPMERIKEIERRGGRVFFVDPRRNESARIAGEHVFIRPDTDVFFLLSFLHEVVERGGVDHTVVDAHMRGLGRVSDLAASYPAARTAEVTGVDGRTLGAIVDAYLTADGASLYCSTGVNQGRHGSLAYWLLNVINAVTGNLDRRGGTLVAPGLFDVAAIAKRAGIGEGGPRSRVGDLPSVMDSLPAAIMADEITTPGPERVRAMFVSAGNPVLSCPDEARMREALGQLELLVSIDLFRNETAELADFVLPATSFLERPDLPLAVHGMQPIPYLQYTGAVVPPDGEQREEPVIYEQLARACGRPLFASRAATLGLRLGRALGRLPGIGSRARLDSAAMLGALLRGSRVATRAQLERAPHGVLLPPVRGGDLLGRRVLTEDGKVDLAPEPLCSEAPAILEAALDGERLDRGRLKLVSKRELRSHNSWLHNADSLLGRRTTNLVYAHPEDARAAGVTDGQRVRVTSASGSVELPLRLTEDLMVGTVALPHGWGHDRARGLRVAKSAPGVNVNRLAAAGPEAVERFAGMSHLNGILVTLEPA